MSKPHIMIYECRQRVKGYDDATSGSKQVEDLTGNEGDAYLQGFLEGLSAQVDWATEALNTAKRLIGGAK